MQLECRRTLKNACTGLSARLLPFAGVIPSLRLRRKGDVSILALGYYPQQKDGKMGKER